MIRDVTIRTRYWCTGIDSSVGININTSVIIPIPIPTSTNGIGVDDIGIVTSLVVMFTTVDIQEGGDKTRKN